MHSTMDRRLPQYYGLMYEEGSWWDPNVDWSKPRPGPLDQWGRISYWHPAWGGFSDEQTFEAVKKSNAYYSWIKSSNHPRCREARVPAAGPRPGHPGPVRQPGGRQSPEGRAGRPIRPSAKESSRRSNTEQGRQRSVDKSGPRSGPTGRGWS